MALDTSIPLQAVTPDFSQATDPRRILSMQQLAMQVQQARQQQQNQNALKALYADPTNLDASGNLNKNALGKVMRIDPATGLQIEQRQLQFDSTRTEAFAKKQEMSQDVRGKALTVYEDALKSGLPEPQAREKARMAQNEGLDDLRKSGLFSEQEQGAFPNDFDPTRARANAMKYSDWLAQQEKLKTDARADKKLNLEEASGARAAEKFKIEKEGIPLNEGGLEEAARDYITNGKLPPGASPQNIAAITSKAAELRKGGISTPKDLGSPVEVVAAGADGKRKQILAQQDKATGQWVTADEKHQPVVVSALSGKETPEAGDTNVEEAAKAIAQYQMAPLTGFAMRSPYGQAVMARVMQVNPDYQATEFGGRSKAVRDFATGRQGDAVRSFNVGISHLNTLDGLVDALKNKDEQTFNRVASRVKEEFGSPAPTNFDSAKAIVGDEIIKAIIGGGGALADRENAQNQLDRAKTPEQLKGVIDTYKDLMAGQLGGLKKQYETTTGLKNFDDRLSDETKDQLETTRGKKAGDAGIKTAATAAWGSYDPSKYDYRINPDTGVLQRKAK